MPYHVLEQWRCEVNGYIAYFKRQRIEIEADSLLDAKLKALEVFNPNKRDATLVAVMLARLGDKPVIHDPAMLG
jgi:hypothetical protein